MYLDYMLVEFEQNRMVQTIQNFELFDKKMVNDVWQSVDAILEDVSVTDTCWMLKYWFKDYHISVFQKLR